MNYNNDCLLIKFFINKPLIPPKVTKIAFLVPFRGIFCIFAARNNYVVW